VLVVSKVRVSVSCGSGVLTSSTDALICDTVHSPYACDIMQQQSSCCCEEFVVNNYKFVYLECSEVFILVQPSAHPK